MDLKALYALALLAGLPAASFEAGTLPTDEEAALAPSDLATLDAVSVTMAEHPGVPQVLRDAMPALIRVQRRRDAMLCEMLHTLEELAHLAAATPAPAAG